MNYLENGKVESLENIIFMSIEPQKYEELLLTGMETISKYIQRKSPCLYILFVKFLQDQYYVEQIDAEEIDNIDCENILEDLKTNVK